VGLVLTIFGIKPRHFGPHDVGFAATTAWPKPNAERRLHGQSRMQKEEASGQAQAAANSRAHFDILLGRLNVAAPGPITQVEMNTSQRAIPS